MGRGFILLVCLIACACAPVATPTPIPTPATSADPELDAAIAQARASVDEFIERIAAPHPARTFVAVKLRFFPPDDSPQDIWLDDATYADGVFRGSMGDDIPSLKLFFGDPVTVRPEEILDWMIVEDGKLIGGYTIRLAYQRMTSEEKQNFLETLDYYSLDE